MIDVTGDALERRVAQSIAPALMLEDTAAVRRQSDPTLSWRRLVVAEGIELLVRDDLPAAHEDTLVAMREAVRAALGRPENR